MVKMMSKMDLSKWKYFNLNDVFKIIENCKCNNASELPDGEDVFYLGAKKKDCGIIKKVQSVPELESKGNCIVLITDGDGSIGYSNYISFDKFIGTVNLVSCYNDEHLNKYTGLFLVTILDKERYKYSFGRKYKNSIQSTEILLPVNDDDEIDWEYMEQYIKQRENIKFSKVKTNNKSNNKLTERTKEFKMSDLFEIKGYGSISATDVEQKGKGQYAYVTRTSKNNGVVGYYDYYTAPGNSISIETTLSGLCFYHEEPFSTGDHIMVLTPIGNTILNKYTALYIKTVWRKSSYKYSYGRPAIKDNILNTYLKLPEKNGNPDWEYMEQYVKSLPYSDLI